MSLNDQTIIDNTHFREGEDGKLYCYTNLPGGEKFEQAVSSKEAVTKGMIGWCNTVRDYLKAMEKEREAKASRKFSEDKVDRARGVDSRRIILDHYDFLQSQIDHLGTVITDARKERDELRNERDKLTPIVTVWRGE